MIFRDIMLNKKKYTKDTELYFQIHAVLGETKINVSWKNQTSVAWEWIH